MTSSGTGPSARNLQDMSANGTKQTCSMRRRNVRFWGKADTDDPLLTKLVYEYTP